MAELATIARPYAEALFKVVGDGDAAGARRRARRARRRRRQPAAAPVRRQPEGRARAGVRRDRRRRQACTLSPSGAATSCARVIDNGRLAALPEIAAQFRALMNAQQRCRPTPSSTAPSRSTPAQLADVVAALEKRFGRKLNATSCSRARADRRHPRGGRRRGARHLGQGPPRTNESGADGLMPRALPQSACQHLTERR